MHVLLGVVEIEWVEREFYIFLLYIYIYYNFFKNRLLCLSEDISPIYFPFVFNFLFKFSFARRFKRAILGFLKIKRRRGTEADDRDESKTPILFFSCNLSFTEL